MSLLGTLAIGFNAAGAPAADVVVAAGFTEQTEGEGKLPAGFGLAWETSASYA